MTRPELVEVAAAELRAREQHYPGQIERGERTVDEAGRGIAAWRAIVALLHNGAVELEPCLGNSCPRAWLQLVDAVQAAVAHRAGQDDPRTPLLAEIRAMLVRSAIRQGATLPSFDAVIGQHKEAA